MLLLLLNARHRGSGRFINKVAALVPVSLLGQPKIALRELFVL